MQRGKGDTYLPVVQGVYRTINVVIVRNVETWKNYCRGIFDGTR